MPLLLLPANSEPPEPPEPGVFADAAIQVSDVVPYIVKPDGNEVDLGPNDWREVHSKRRFALQDTLEYVCRQQSALVQTEYSSATALEDRWKNWGAGLQVRGGTVVEGPVTYYKYEWDGRRSPSSTVYQDPTAQFTLLTEPWFVALCRRRVVETADGTQYSKTDYPKNIFHDLIKTSGVSGQVITPTGWQQASEVRHDFGSWALAVGSDVGSGTQITFKADVGENLLDALIRLCNTPTSDADKLWPTQSRSGTTITLSCLIGRSGGGRQIGTDKSTLEVSAVRGNLAYYAEEGSYVSKENHPHMSGKGIAGSGQRHRFRFASGSADDGIYENYINITHGGTDDELDKEGDRRLFEFKDGTVTREMRVRELPDFQWITDFGIKDTLGVFTPLGDTVTPLIIGDDFDLVAPGPGRVGLLYGQFPPTVEREVNNRSGGMSGGRGGGGRPSRKSGEPNQDPDDILSYGSRCHNDGVTTVVDGVNQLDGIVGEKDTSGVLRAYTEGREGGAPGAQDLSGIRLHATLLGATQDPDDAILIRLDSGLSIIVNGKVHTNPGTPSYECG